MKKIGIDFDNQLLLVLTDNTKGTQNFDVPKKIALNSFIPPEYHDRNSFTWDFEGETIAINLPDIGCPKGLAGEDSFNPEIEVSLPGLSTRYDEFLAILRLSEETVSAQEIFDFVLKELIGMDYEQAKALGLFDEDTEVEVDSSWN